MFGRPQKATKKWNARNIELEFMDSGPVPGLKAVLERRLSTLRRELSSCLEKRRPRLFISPPVLFLLCSSSLLLPEMRHLWKTVNISIHSMLEKYVLAHVSLLWLFFMAACEDSSSSAWTRSSANQWGSIFR